MGSEDDDREHQIWDPGPQRSFRTSPLSAIALAQAGSDNRISEKFMSTRNFQLHVRAVYSTLYLTLLRPTARGGLVRPRGRSGAMNTFRQLLSRLMRGDDGPTATEYAVMIAVICVAVIGALSSFGIHMDNLYTSLAATIPTGSSS